jgi:hypothetical protein
MSLYVLDTDRVTLHQQDLSTSSIVSKTDVGLSSRCAGELLR